MRPSSLLPIQTDPARRFLAADVAGEDAQETLRPPQEEIADPLGRLDFVEGSGGDPHRERHLLLHHCVADSQRTF
jgi:hypothetical protein